MPQEFNVRDCSLTAIATGRRAQSLRELRDHIRDVDTASIYYHFWGSRLLPRFDDPEYNNDFAAWTKHALRDDITAERLALVDPTLFSKLEDLRTELLEVVEERIEEQDNVQWAAADQKFYFIRSQIVVLDTPHILRSPKELVDVIPLLPVSSIFYHFIDARRRTDDGRDDFSTWLEGFGESLTGLRKRLAEIDYYFGSLGELKRNVAAAVESYTIAEGSHT